ncbi:MAG: WYL domain-containing protein [Oscillospiraceae bacterium]|nr:WYL domain-containing protein [Oscillospiraceae bacterium]
MNVAHTNEPILSILEVLRKHSDSEHTLTQKQIGNYIKAETGESLDRETIKRNLRKLLDSQLPVEALKEEPSITGLYYDHDFTDGELCLLINSVLFTDGLSKKHRKDLIKRIEALTDKYFHSYVSKVDLNVYENVRNSEIFLNLEIISEAIAKKKQISFIKTDNNKTYEVSPYQFVFHSGHQYLLCHYPEHDDPISHFRIDRLKKCEVMDVPAKQIRDLKGFESGIQLSDYVREHPNMWGGEAINITFRCEKYLRNHLVEQFGTEINIEETDDDMLLVRLKASELAMFHWGLQYLDSVEILSPESLRSKLKAALKDACRKYCSDSETEGDNS